MKKKKGKPGESSCSSGGLGKHTDENAPNPTLIKIASTSLSCKRMLAWISHSSFQKIVKLQKASLALNVYLWHFQDDPFWVSFIAELLCLCVWVCVCAGYSWWHMQTQKRRCHSAGSPVPVLASLHGFFRSGASAELLHVHAPSRGRGSADQLLSEVPKTRGGRASAAPQL